MDLPELRDCYRRTLLKDVVPFWIHHGIDSNGGINTCMGDDGRVISRDRWNWSQWRAVWVFSKLYNSIEAKPEWLKIAEGIHDFVASHGPLEGGHWPLLLDGDGALKRGYDSIYVDGFAIYGLVELWRANRRDEILQSALRTFHAVEQAFASKEPPPAWPYPIPQGRTPHGLSMIFSLAYHELGQATGDSEVRAACDRHHERVMKRYLRSDRGFVLEWLNEDGSECDPPEGRAVCPGHAIESMWFQMHIARAKRDNETIRKAIETIRFHLEKGWDSEYGGLFLAIDADGNEEVGWPHAETKLWWPHAEALYSTLLAYEVCKEDWCLEWHERVREFSYSHYPVHEHGEWRQKLDRRGNPIAKSLFLPVKDPFHLPRALIYCVEVLGRLIDNAAA